MKTSLIFLSLMVANATLFLFTFATLFNWFIVPLGVPSIGIVHAWGIGCLITIFRSPNRTKELQAKDQEALNKIAISYMANRLIWVFGFLFTGYILTFFM